MDDNEYMTDFLRDFLGQQDNQQRANRRKYILSPTTAEILFNRVRDNLPGSYANKLSSQTQLLVVLRFLCDGTHFWSVKMAVNCFYFKFRQDTRTGDLLASGQSWERTNIEYYALNYSGCSLKYTRTHPWQLG